MNEKISIIIPCYNTERFLPKCLDSIVNQTYRNLEIICIIDGSPDSSLTICNQYAEKDKRIVVINQDNQGSSGARNTGLKRATGKYVMFVDSDDWLELSTCEQAISKIEEYGCDLVFWPYVRELSSCQKEKKFFGEANIYFDSDACKKLHRRIFGLYGEELANPENADAFVTACGKLYKAEMIKNISFVDIKKIGSSEDTLFNCCALTQMNSAYYIPECLYHYRKYNEGSITKNYRPNLFEQWNCLFNEMFNIIDSNNLESEFNIALNNRIALSIIGLGLNELSNPNGTFVKIKKIKTIISSAQYKKVYKSLVLKYFPIHWKIFFLFAKMNFSTGLYVLLVIMKKMIGK